METPFYKSYIRPWVLITTHDCRFSQAQSFYQFSQQKSPRFEWSAFASSPLVVWDLTGDLANQELALCGCTALLYWIMTFTVNCFHFSQFQRQLHILTHMTHQSLCSPPHHPQSHQEFFTDPSEFEPAQPSDLHSNNYTSLPGGQVFSPCYFHVSISIGTLESDSLSLSIPRRTKWTLVYFIAQVLKVNALQHKCWTCAVCTTYVAMNQCRLILQVHAKLVSCRKLYHVSCVGIQSPTTLTSIN